MSRNIPHAKAQRRNGALRNTAALGVFAPLREKTSHQPRTNVAFTKLQRRLAFLVILLPFLGVIAALILASTSGVGWVEVLLLLGMYMAGAVGTEVGFHRFFTHRSFQANKFTRMLLAVLGSMNAQGPVLFWAAIHRRHHQFSDQAGDPHSPHVYANGKRIGSVLHGLWHAHVGWLFADEVTDWGRYVPDLLRDKIIFKINRYYFVWVLLGLAFPALAGGLLLGTWLGVLKGFLWGGLVRIFLAQQVTWGVNSLGHVYGSRPFSNTDSSANNGWLALLSIGGSWHNNHHAFPTSAWHGLKWWQIDLAGWFISFMAVAGLANNVEAPAPEAIARLEVQEKKGSYHAT